MKINLKNSKGITIITLIITIIVMIILATISIKYGLRSINSVQDSTIETGLETVQQALIQQYTKANSINGENNEITDFSKKSDKYYGTPQSEDDIKKILEKHGVKGSENKFNLLNFDYTNNKYTSTVTDDNAYYLLEPSDLEKLGITGAKGSSYLVNYSTGEVWDLGNVMYEDGEYAYINGIGTELEIAKEDFVDSPIKISLVGDVKSENGKYTITLRVTDELAKISSDPNDKDKHITNKDIIDNIITLKVDDTKVDKSKITVKDPIVKPDNKQSIKEYYEYVIEVEDSTEGGNDFPELDIIINEGAIEDVKDYSNPKTELSAIINDSTKNHQTGITFSLGTPTYETENSKYPNGFDDGNGAVWGTSANVELKLKCENGLKSQDYVFNYKLEDGETKKITLRAREGEKEVSGTIRLESDTGRGLELKVWSANPSDTGRNSNPIGNGTKTASVNLDNEHPKITVYYDDGSGKKELTEDYYSRDDVYFRANKDQVFDMEDRYTSYAKLTPNIVTEYSDEQSGIESYLDSWFGTNTMLKELKDKLNYKEDAGSYDSTYCTIMNKWNSVVNVVGNTVKSYTIYPEFGGMFAPTKTKEDVEEMKNPDSESAIRYLKNPLVSGEYYILFDYHPALIAEGHYLSDIVGNMRKDLYHIGPIKVDTFSPIIEKIDINNDGKITISDDYSGITNDYSKIKYAWVKNIGDTPSKWESITEKNVKILEYNDVNSPKKLNITVNPPKEKGEWYLCANITGFTDIAGNEAGSDNMYSDEAFTTITYDIELNYVTKDTDNPNGFTDSTGTTWGTSANVNVTLECKNGLKEQEYVFDYVYKDEKNQPIKTGSITLKPNENDKTVTGTITLDSYSGKGVLTVTPNDEHYSGTNSYELGNDSKSVNVNLDNEIPELKVYYGDENSKTELTSEYYLRNDVFFRTYQNVNAPDVRGLGYFNPGIYFTFNDNLSKIKMYNRTWYRYWIFSKSENESLENYPSEISYVTWKAWTGGSVSSYDKFLDPMRIEIGGVIGCTTDKQSIRDGSNDKAFISGEYYLCLTHIPPGTTKDYRLADNVGNNTLNQTKIGPLKIDTFSPVIDSVEVIDNGKIIISDDYSGLSEDYSKIKYAWVKNKNETPSEWLDVEKENVEVIEYNEFNNAEKIEVTIKRENKYNGYYLCTKIEGFEDFAGNPAGSDCKYSEKVIVPIEYNIELNYQTKDTDNPNGFTDSEGITWGTSANVNVILKCENGLKAQDYIFNYVYKDENNKTIKNGKITLKPNEDDKEATGTITLDSYSGKGVLTVTPTDEHYSGTNSYELGNESKSVDVNLDNEIPELKVWYDDGSGEKELTEDYYSKNDVFFRFAHSDKKNTDVLDNLTPDITFLFEDKFSDVKLYEGIKWNSWAISKAEDDKLPPTLSTNNLYAWQGQRFSKEVDGYGKSFITLFGYFRPTEKREELLKPGYDENPNLEESEKKKNRYLLSGKYYFWFSHIAPNSNNKTPLCDNVGNAKLNFSKIGPLKFDTFSPRINSINVDDGKIIISDDYSGLSNDYTKIKYAWVANKNETPNESDWKTITSKNVRILGTNEFENLEKIEITAEQPEQTGELYLCAKIEGYTDIAGNEAGNTIVYSKETLQTESNLLIDVTELNKELSYPTTVNINVKSESNKKFGIKEIWYEHEGLDDRIDILTTTKSYPTGEGNETFDSTVNGPIIVHVIDSFGKEYTKEFKMEMVQETILTFNIESRNEILVLPLIYTYETYLMYVDWGDGNSHYVTKSAISHDSKNVIIENEPNRAVHKYANSGNKTVKISSKGGANGFCGWADMYQSNLTVPNFPNETIQALKKSRSQLIEVQQFGIHKSLVYGSSMEKFYLDCTNLKKLPKENMNAFKDVITFERTFCNTGIESIPEKLFNNAERTPSFNECFRECHELKRVTNNIWGNINKSSDTDYNVKGMFSYCTNLEHVDNIFEDFNIVSLENVFRNCESLTYVDKDIFKGCKNVTDLGGTFFYCSSLTELDLNIFSDMKDNVNNWSTYRNDIEDENRKVIGSSYCSGIFAGCKNLEKCPKIWEWEKLKNLTDENKKAAYNIFKGTSDIIINQIPEDQRKDYWFDGKVY